MDRNGYFRLYNDDSGIYLECFPHMDNGAPVKIDDVIFYLDAKGIKGIDVTEINKYIANGDFSTKFKLTNETGYHESEYLKIEVDKYGGKVVGRFFAPSNEGDVMTKDEIIEELKRNNINHGYVMKNIDIFVRARLYCTDILLAKATAPIHGHDARIEYYFDTEVVAKPKLPSINSLGSCGRLTPARLNTKSHSLQYLSSSSGVLSISYLKISRPSDGRSYHLAFPSAIFFSCAQRFLPTNPFAPVTSIFIF